MKTRKIFKLGLIVLLFNFSGCKKLVEVDGPITSISSANVYQNDATAVAVLTGLYAQLSSDGLKSGIPTSVTLLSGLSADEFVLNSAVNASYDMNLILYYNNDLGSQTAGFEFWNSIYPDLYVVNAALEGINKSNTLTPRIKKQLLGESYFMRAFYFFYLVNLYGDVPLITTTDYKINAVMLRTSKENVWLQIIEDLKKAQDLLDNDYLDISLLRKTEEKVRPNKNAATALLARAYLYTKNWANAEIQASSVINNPAYHLVSLDEVFKKNNDEAIWQFQPVLSKTAYTAEATLFVVDLNILAGSISRRPVFLNPDLINSFETGDQRRNKWVNNVTTDGLSYYFAYKYKVRTEQNLPITEYSTVLRVGEQYLIRAEARIHLGNINGGIADLNVLRDRATSKIPGSIQLAQLSELMSLDQALIAVEHERRIELFTEWGHRWLDLKRTGRINEVMKLVLPQKSPGKVWNNNLQFYPIQFQELVSNNNLIQTPGY